MVVENAFHRESTYNPIHEAVLKQPDYATAKEMIPDSPTKEESLFKTRELLASYISCTPHILNDGDVAEVARNIARYEKMSSQEASEVAKLLVSSVNAAYKEIKTRGSAVDGAVGGLLNDGPRSPGDRKIRGSSDLPG